MKYKFSKRSLDALWGVHPKLVDTVYDVLEAGVMDFSVVEGLRTLAKQREYFEKGASKTMNSKHLKQPDGHAHAVDLYPYPIDMKAVRAGMAKEIVRFGVLAGMMLKAAPSQGIILRWGGDWDLDGETLDHTFTDMPHFEIHKFL